MLTASDVIAPDRASPSAWRLVRRMLALGWRYRRGCVLIVALQVLLVSLNVAGLGLTGLGIDVVRHAFDPSLPPIAWPWGLAPPVGWPAMQVVAAIAAAIGALGLLVALVKYAAAYASADLSQRVLIQLRTDVYDKLQRLSFHFFDTAESSSLINRASGDVQAVRTFVDGVIVKLLTVTLSLAVFLGYMLAVHVPLTLACLVTSPLLWWGARFSRMVQPLYRRNSELGDRMITRLAESVQGVHVIKGFAREDDQIAGFRAATQQIRDQKREIFRRISTYQPLMGFVTQVNLLVLIGFGGFLVVRGEMSLGAGMFVFANLLHEFANQVGQLTNIAGTIQASLTGAERVFEVLDRPLDIQSPEQAAPLPRARGEVQFEHVSLGYGGGELVLRDVSLHLRAGECVGIVGETGAGKSTLLSLLPRFYDVSAGRILIDGHDVRDLNLDDLRRNIGMVFQESFLFSNTVAANIAFGLPAAGPAAIERAAEIAAADEFIAELPLRYQTVIGEYGSNLSGGQRQRLAIARALLLDPPILLLDDATASVDAHTEHEIQEAIQSALRGRTTLLVSNRISTLRRADRIVVLQRGRIVQQGSHAELLRTPGYYRRLAELQFADLPDESSATAPGDSA